MFHFTFETRQQLVDLLIEAFARDLIQGEEDLLEVMTRPNRPPLGYADPEPALRMTLSDRTEDRRLLQRLESIPETSGLVVGVFSLVHTLQDTQSTWYFITPCRYYFEREVNLEGLPVRCVPYNHFLVGTQCGHVYLTGGEYDQYSGQMYKPPLRHEVVEIF